MTVLKKIINLLRVVRSSLLTTEVYGLAQIHRLMEEEKGKGRKEMQDDEAMTSKCSFDNVERIKSSRPQEVFPVCFAL